MALPKSNFDQNDHDHLDHGINFFFALNQRKSLRFQERLKNILG